MMRPAALLAALTALAACAAPNPAEAEKSALFGQPWNSGRSAGEPAFQVQAIDADTYAIRQSLRSTFEAPFLYLLFGRDKALLIDTGVEGAALRPVIERLVAARTGPRPALVVMHSHGHTDHTGGDPAFRDRPDTVVVGHAPSEVAAFFGVRDWPDGRAAFDLGGRVVDILPTPGHQPAHAMVFDRATRLLFSGDAVYPGRLTFQCGRAAEYAASIDRVAAFAKAERVRWLLGAHIEMRAAPGKAFEGEDHARRDEHRLELSPSVLGEIRSALVGMGSRPRVETHDDFILFPHPADPRGKSPPDWCLAEAAAK